MTRGGGKRERLIESAADLFHRRGIAGATLAEIAEAADVPPGNVYYYFKTRDELIRAVIEFWTDRFAQLVEPLEREPDPRQRLKALAHFWAAEGQLVAEAGCPVGSLSGDLNKQGQELREGSAQLFGLLLDWASGQFAQLGCEEPRDCAIELVAGLQGAALLSASFADPGLVRRQVSRLERWIDGVGRAGRANSPANDVDVVESKG